MNELPTLTINTDGASRGNPGDAAFGYVIARAGSPPIEEGGRLGKLTNNQAEYTAVVRALEHALRLGDGFRVVVRCDSELLVKQVTGAYRVKNADLRPIYEKVLALKKRFSGGVTFQHVRRSLNSRADELCNEALDGLRTASDDEAEPAPPSPAPPPDRVLAYLEQVKSAWSEGLDQPSVAEVRDRLLELM
jgi:ribonuclease HI